MISVLAVPRSIAISCVKKLKIPMFFYVKTYVSVNGSKVEVKYWI